MPEADAARFAALTRHLESLLAHSDFISEKLDFLIVMVALFRHESLLEIARFYLVLTVAAMAIQFRSVRWEGDGHVR